MSTNPNDIIGLTHKRVGEVEQAAGGLTKREHFALELAKARIGNAEIFKKHGAQHHGVAQDAVMWADALIARLNGIMPVAVVEKRGDEN